jgi:rhamnosyl/mannosyltransferase
LSAFKRFSELAKDADIVHYHFPWPFMDLVHFATRHKKPTIVTYHSDIVKQKKLLRLYQPLMNQFLQSVDAIVATSPNYQATSDVLQKYQSKVHLITYGLDRDLYPAPSADKLNYWRNELGDKFFLFVGVLRLQRSTYSS